MPGCASTFHLPFSVSPLSSGCHTNIFFQPAVQSFPSYLAPMCWHATENIFTRCCQDNNSFASQIVWVLHVNDNILLFRVFGCSSGKMCSCAPGNHSPSILWREMEPCHSGTEPRRVQFSGSQPFQLTSPQITNSLSHMAKAWLGRTLKCDWKRWIYLL